MEIIDQHGEPLDPARWGEQDLYDKVLPRMHLVVDAARPPPRAGGIVPTAHHPLAVAKRPAPTNVAVVQQVHPDGSCDVQFVCNCRPLAVWPPSAASLPATSCVDCGAGRTAILSSGST